MNLECKLLTAKGNSIWIAVRGKADFEHGQCVRVFGSIQDISSRVASVSKNSFNQFNVNFTITPILLQALEF